MTLGIFAKIFARPTVEDVFAAVARHHLRCVQFNFASAGLPSLPDVIEPELAKGIRKSAAEHRLAIGAVSGTFNMIHPDAKRRRDGLHKLGVIAAACEPIGATLVTLCTGTRDPENMWRHHPDNDSPEAWRDLTVSMTKALTIADKHNLTLGIEPETGNVVSSARHARRLLDEMKSPRLKVIMDAANLFHPGDLPRMNEILDEAFDLLGGDIALVHAKELGPDGHAGLRRAGVSAEERLHPASATQAGGLAVGAGVLDWDRYLSLLRSAKFDGSLIMHGFDERDVAASMKFLREKLASEKKS